MKVSGWHIVASGATIGGVAWLAWRYLPRKVKVSITMSPLSSRRATTLFALGLLEQAKTFTPDGRRQLILQLIELGYLPDIPEGYAEPENFDALLYLIERRAALPPETTEA